MRVAVRRTDGYAHRVELEGGHELRIDEPVATGGADTGPRPTQLLGASLAGCIAITMEMYARRKEWEIGEVEVAVDIGYEGHVPRSFDVSIDLPAELSEEQRERLLRVATKCPVHKVLAGEAKVTIAERMEPA